MPADIQTSLRSPAAYDLARKAREAITETVGEQLAATYLPEAQVNGGILEAGDVLSAELNSVTRAIETVKRTTEEYGQELVAATQKVQAENKTLESQLAETTAELGRLRENLDQVRRDAMTDGLTGLTNRKAFDERLAAICAETEAQDKPMALA